MARARGWLALGVVLLLGMALASDARAAGMTITEQTHATVKSLVCAWTSNANGNASASTTAYLSGQVLALIHIPGTGASKPTDNYDAWMVDANGADILMGGGFNADDTDQTYKTPAKTDLGAIASSQVEVQIRNAGNAKSGTLIIWIR